jgi:hypothetical protein
MVQSKMCGVKADLVQTAFGTPMFSQRPDRGYFSGTSIHPLALGSSTHEIYDVYLQCQSDRRLTIDLCLGGIG